MTCYGPKSLIEIGDKTVIDHQIDAIRDFDKGAEIIVVCGFESRKMIAHCRGKVRLVENMEFATTNGDESLRLAMNASGPGNIYVIHGDLLFDQSALFLPDVSINHILIDTKKRLGDSSVGVTHYKGRVTNLSYGLDDKWGQILYVPFSNRDALHRVCESGRKTRSIYELVNSLIKRGSKFSVYENKGLLQEIDSNKDIP